MKRGTPFLFSTLYSQVIATKSSCRGCGACVLVCPNDRLVFRDDRPEQVSGEKHTCPENVDDRCGLCAMACPQLNPPEQSRPVSDKPTIVAARTTDPKLAEACQDGGVVSSIARWGLQSKRWSSFVGWTRDNIWQPLPLVVTETGDVPKTSGSKYTHTSIDAALRALYRQDRASEPFAIVGLPCHMKALRRLQDIHSKYVKGMGFCIGLLCSKAFSYERLIQGKLINELRIPIQDVSRMAIQKGSFTVIMRSGDTHQIPIKELGDYGHCGCASCGDFSAELADISVGGLGTDGWTIVLIRTREGQEVMQAVEAYGLIETAHKERFESALHLLEKLTSLKRKRAEKRNG